MTEAAAQMVDVEANLLREIADAKMKRQDVALTYAFGLRSVEPIDWSNINGAIVERWLPPAAVATAMRSER